MSRALQHKSCAVEGFTKRYNVTRLVYYEVFRYVNNAIARETEIKKWRREKKAALIERSIALSLSAEDWRVTTASPVRWAKKADSSLRSE
jgi:predicted GIY-YIG superfamily endonuclease